MSARAPIAKISEFPFGAPNTLTAVLRFSVVKPGRYTIRFVNTGDATLTFSVQTSADNSSFAATTAQKNVTAITSLTVTKGCVLTYELVLRTEDKFIKVLASGNTTGAFQVVEPGLDPVALA